jgi:serine phosphatase RsbU (regulator of sigma subunit)
MPRLKFSIVQKLAILCSTTALVSSLSVAGLAYFTAKQTLEAEINTRLERVSGFLMHSIDRFIYERLSDMSALTQSTAELTAASTLEGSDWTGVTAQLQQYKATNQWYTSISYFDSARVRRADTEGLSIGRPHKYSSYWVALDSQTLAMDVSWSESLGKPVMHFASEVRAEDGRRTGALVSRVAIEQLHAFFKSELSVGNGAMDALGSQVNIELLDSEGMVLYSSRHPQDVLQRKYRSLTLLNRQMSHLDPQTNHQGYIDLGHDLVYFTKQKGYLDYRGSGWILLMSLPKEAALAQVHSLKDQVQVILLILLGLAGLAAWLIGRYFAQPLLSLKEAARQLASGQLGLQHHQLGRSLDRGDEIGHLARDFAQMAEALDRQMSEQTALNAALSLTNQEIGARNQKIASQKLGLETALTDLANKNKKITSSINYALRIQTAFLPVKEGLKDLFPSSFILYQPKDIVSGDFYWFRQIKRTSLVSSEVVVVVAADCTGHGVPGALMTIIAENLLQQVLLHERLLDPAQALLRLDHLMKLVLKREGYAEGINHDGMDIALCIIDLRTKQLDFAGAHQSLFINRQGQLHELKGDRFSIGAVHKNAKATTATTQNFPLQSGDWLYLLTDGYTDQFGGKGAEGPATIPASKFGRQRLRTLLTELGQHPAEAQLAQLGQVLGGWQGPEQQTDDITAIGIKFGE